MVDDGIVGAHPAVRVSAGGTNLLRSQELLEAGRESDTSIRVAEVGSTGLTGLEPLVLATIEGETAFFPECGTERLRAIVGDLGDGALPTDDAMAVADHEPGTPRLPIPDDGPLGVGNRTVLGGCGWTIPTSIEDYRGDGGAIAAEIDGDAAGRLADAGLRGRGRGDAAADTPLATQWETAVATEGDPVVVVNANDADPHAEMDRLLLESDPFSVCDAALAAAHAVSATDVVVYTNEAETLATERAEAAAEALADELDMEISIHVVAGPDEYKAGEPTMALEAIEGNHRIEARRGPPGPSEYGVDGRPTLVHTPRTFAQIGRVLGDGLGDDDLGGEDLGGSSADPGTRLFTVAGDVAAPATIELSTDATLAAVLSAVELADGHKAACVGGVFGGLTRSLDVPASAPGRTDAGLGTDGVVDVIGESTCAVAFAGKHATFAREENCGRCVPCREGSKQLVNLLRDVYRGEHDDGMVRELARTMRESSLCGFGRDASRPVTTAMETFETEFSAHAEGRCPAGACTQL